MRLSRFRLLAGLAGAFLSLSPTGWGQGAVSSFGQPAAAPSGQVFSPDVAKFSDSRGDSKSGSQSVSNTVALTNSMEVLNNDVKLNRGDTLSYRVVEERTPPIPMTVTDSGEVEVPFIGRVSAAGKTCKQLALAIKPILEKEYFYKATVVVGLSTLSTRSRGRIYLTGQVRSQGAMEIPADETLTVSKAIMRAGGVADFGNPNKIQLTRRVSADRAETTIVNLTEILKKGRLDKDPVVMPDDVINVPDQLIHF